MFRKRFLEQFMKKKIKRSHFWDKTWQNLQYSKLWVAARKLNISNLRIVRDQILNIIIIFWREGLSSSTQGKLKVADLRSWSQLIFKAAVWRELSWDGHTECMHTFMMTWLHICCYSAHILGCITHKGGLNPRPGYPGGLGWRANPELG